jgi:hypothetical protein
MEIWKSLNGVVENGKNYSISTLGNVRNDKGLIMKHNIMKDGYHRIRLCKNKKRKDYYIHKLVALAFLPNPENKFEVDHIDRDKNNNTLENLRWSTRSENTQNADKRKDCSSQYIGVCWDKSNKKWKAQMNVDGKLKYLGVFVNEIDAAKCYDKHVFSEFQTKNFP